MRFNKLLTAIGIALLLASCTAVPEVGESDLLKNTNNKLRSLALKPATDARSDYAEIFCKNTLKYAAELGFRKNCNNYIHGADRRTTGIRQKTKRNSNIKILFVTGIFGQCIDKNVVMFSGARKFLREKKIPEVEKLEFLDAEISGYSSSGINARQLRQTVDNLVIKPGERLVIVAYSKGVSDTIEMLAGFPETTKKIDAVLSVGGVVLGSPLAENKRVFDKLFQSISTSCKGPDGKGLTSLKPAIRQNYLKQNKLPEHINYYSLVGNVSRRNTSFALLPLWDMLSLTSSNSDSQVTTDDAVIPGAKMLAFIKADHWAMAMPFDTNAPLLSKTLITRNSFPREILLRSAMEMIVADLPR